MVSFLILTVAFFVSSAFAVNFQKSCHNVSLPFTVTSTNFIYGGSPFVENVDFTCFVQDYNRRDFLTSFVSFSGAPQAETATYTIAGTFCEPFTGSSTVLVATHGGTYDRSYWDSPYQPENYHFVDYAVGQGYSVFFYDRMGAGQSTVASGYITQFPIQVAILEKLVDYIRAGSLTTGRHSTATTIPRKIVLLGHSMGSVISNALVASNPTIADGVILTGWGFDTGTIANSFGLTAATLQPKIASPMSQRWSSYDNGWFTVVDIFAYINAFAILFFKVPFFDMNAAAYFLNTSWPVAIMEVLTLGVLNFPAPNVTAPVLFLNGEYDYIMCGGYCPGVLLPAASNIFPASVGFEAYIQPNTGHVLNLNLNATGGYKAITDFLAKNGL